MEQSLFAPRMLIAWIGGVLLTLMLSLALMFHDETATTVGPSTFSVSAIGHAGIADILRRRGFTVIQSQGDSVHKLGAHGVLVLAEPDFTSPDDTALKALLRARTVLLVLPKWHGHPDPDGRGWIDEATPLSPFLPQSILEAGFRDAKLIRPDSDVTWTRNDLEQVPHVSAPLQVLETDSAIILPPLPKRHALSPGSDRISPIIESDAGILLGEIGKSGHRLWILSDPDVISNHGLSEGNAPLAIAIFEALDAGGPIVFDETIHGFVTVPTNPLKLLMRAPFAAVASLGVAAFGLLLWAGTARFGAPEPAPVPLKAGKRDLVRNIARLFRYAGYQDVLVRRYAEETIRDVARQLHAPAKLDTAATLGWLQRAGAARRVSVDGTEIGTRAAMLTTAQRQPSAELFRLAREIYRWKQEMLDGTAGSAGDRRTNSRRSPQSGSRTG